MQAKNKLLSEENEETKHEIEENRKQVVNLYNLAAKFPRKKIFSRDTYTMDKETCDKLMDALAYHDGLVNNTLTSDEDRQAIAEERKKQERITANMEQEVQQQAKQMVAARITELEDEKKEYEKLRKEADKIILNMAYKTANRMFSSYAKLSKKEKKELLKPAYTAEKRELQKTDDFDILF